ncbi:MAG TPA: hypothetical protein VLT85_09170 [Terriglobales bacterium]|nr:hypothetical protein [Terriglobales bacterium]
MSRAPLALLALVLLAGCSSEAPKPVAPVAKQPPQQETLTGRMAFQKLYQAARLWNADARCFRLESAITKESNGRDGKSGVWRAIFASPGRGIARPFTWSGLTADDAPNPGVAPAGPEDSFNPANTSTQPFDIVYLKADSDQSLEVAQKHGGEAILKKDPNQPVRYILDWNPKKSQLEWHVIYGTAELDAKLNVAVNASSGDFVRVEK